MIKKYIDFIDEGLIMSYNIYDYDDKLKKRIN